MCVAAAAAGAPSVTTSYERGRPMPLVAGATSKAILAQLPPRRLTRLLACDQGSAGAAGLRATLAAIRKRGHCISPRRGSIAAWSASPCRWRCRNSGWPPASASWSEQARLDGDLEHRLVLLLVSSAGMLGERLRAGVPSLGPVTEAAQ